MGLEPADGAIRWATSLSELQAGARMVIAAVDAEGSGTLVTMMVSEST